ncbi:MAG: preprotein translocase subunit SecE [Planctomycetes bacterium]|nr:preprotein translocase subunit SecE [Planctomycetota bacterium]
MGAIYKEDQGKVARIILVTVIMLGAVFALQQLHGYMPKIPDWKLFGLIDENGLALQILDWRYMVHGPLIVLAIMFAYSQFNRPKTADFLIETENELKNKVTWPSRKEEVSASVVVVVTVLILSVFIFGVDYLMKLFSEGLFYPN